MVTGYFYEDSWLSGMEVTFTEVQVKIGRDRFVIYGFPVHSTSMMSG